MNNKKVKITVLIILILIIMGISTYLIFTNKSLMPTKENNSLKEEPNSSNKETNQEENKDENINEPEEYNIEYFDKIIEVKLDSLLNKNKIHYFFYLL